MIWLALCVFFTSCLIIGFKYFQKYGVNTLPAVAINYLTCSILGFVTQPDFNATTQLKPEPWLFLTIALGLVFIVVFTILGITTQRNGVTVAAIANRLSVIIPVSIALVYYGEKITIVKIIGIILALIAVVLTNIQTSKQKNNSAGFLLPVILFIGSGITDSFLNYIQRFYLPEHFYNLFISIVFGTAFLAGTIGAIFMRYRFGKKEFIAGILLGIPNFASIFTILKALQNPHIEDSIVWPINNVGVIVFTALYALIVFKEKLNAYNFAGIAIALAAILMMTLF
jgi:drug/metabolite transporter (DMT)-like permease